MLRDTRQRRLTPATDAFAPAWWCPGAQFQTLCGTALRARPHVSLTRERWETPDGDFLDIDVLPSTPGVPQMLVLHGLEGSSRSKQVLGVLREAHRLGWGGLAVNFRSCSGEPNRLKRAYHAGETGDVAWVVEQMCKRNPGVRILAVGLSLGGNVLLKYLGERGTEAPEALCAAVAISTPFQLARSVRWLERGMSRYYSRNLVHHLRRKTREKLQLHPGLVDTVALDAVRTLAEFDQVVTAPLHGFLDAETYWATSSSERFLGQIRRPTLLINAEDDPFFPGGALPRQISDENHWLTTHFVKHGGHLGFVGGEWPWRPLFWAEQTAVRFLSAHAVGQPGP